MIRMQGVPHILAVAALGYQEKRVRGSEKWSFTLPHPPHHKRGCVGLVNIRNIALQIFLQIWVILTLSLGNC